MAHTAEKTDPSDLIWSYIRKEAVEMVESEPVLAGFLYSTMLNHDTLEQALSYHLSQKLGNTAVPSILLRQVFDEVLASDPDIIAAIRADILAVFERDPACTSHLEPLLYFKGFHALQCYRIGHWLWNNKRKPLALFLQNRISEVFSVDIHPAAKIGQGIMIDHGTGVVIGETTVIEDNVSLLQNVTLGGTGKETGDRHPKIRQGALICSGAKILGNIEVGECAKVGAASVVLQNVPAHCTAVGVPAKIVGSCCPQPAREMDQSLPLD
ncbi:serine O-acetyltransferase [Kiloniella laminariae]|uniref:Serine acetyltransferase n=1 Tax=Kiloniella laminariae TaxID=454162 RepID=A0ABT4LNS0_9PROT|nr:serine O-acetyltransferase [Kiloniella laminariae]MCZ4282540.1 serine O-acetyltransferase [Kiloniella laminariae]